VNTQVYNQSKYLLSRVLTIVEATTSDSEQRKATKDLLNDLFYGSSYWNDIRWHFKQLAEANGFDELFDVSTIEPVPELNIYEEL